MKNAMFKFSAALTLAAAATSAAYAGGFMLTEQSVAGLGRAYAGSGIVGDDLSAVWYNPAGMVLLPGTQFQMGSVMAFSISMLRRIKEIRITVPSTVCRFPTCSSRIR